MKAEVVYSVPEHCGLLAEAMDEEGRELIRAGWGVDVQKGLERAYWSCPLHLRWTILLDGQVVGMFGCAESTDEPGVGEEREDRRVDRRIFDPAGYGRAGRRHDAGTAHGVECQGRKYRRRIGWALYSG